MLPKRIAALVAIVVIVIVAAVILSQVLGQPLPSSGVPPTPIGTAPPASTVASGASASPRPAVGHVWWILLENHEFGSVIGNATAPYLNDLASRYELLTNFYATTHPSEPNYIALVAGSTLGVGTDGTYDLTGSSLFSQLAAAGKTWRAYEQDYPGGCFTGSSASGGVDGPGVAGSYARKHDPAISFTAVSTHPAQCANIQPLRQFDPGAAAFEFITPNLINDMHDGSPAQGDAFLRAFVPLITGSPAFATGVLVITFDEGSSGAGSHGDGGGRVATLVIAPGVQPGSRYATYADHYSLLRTTQDLLGLPCLATSCSRTSITY